jgi:hypothetical protein
MHLSFFKGSRIFPTYKGERWGVTLQELFWIFFEDKILRVRDNLVDRPHAAFELFRNLVLAGDAYSNIVLICNYRVRLSRRD